jgi:hypothetical protein
MAGGFKALRKATDEHCKAKQADQDEKTQSTDSPTGGSASTIKLRRAAVPVVRAGSSKSRPRNVKAGQLFALLRNKAARSIYSLRVLPINLDRRTERRLVYAVDVFYLQLSDMA